MRMVVKACRICLATGVKLYSLLQEPLRTAIGFVINMHNDPSSFPCYVCYECAPLLQRCSRFIQYTQNTQSILFRIYMEQGEVTETAIKSTKREQLNVRSNLSHHRFDPDSIIHIQHEDEDFKDDLPLASILGVELSSIKSEDESVLDVDSALEINKEFEAETEYDAVFPKKRRRKSKTRKEESSHKVKSPKKPKTEKKRKSKSTAKRKNKEKPKTDELKDIETNDEEGEMVKDKRKTRALDAQLSKFFTIVMLSYEEQVAEVERRRQSSQYGAAPHCCQLCHRAFQRRDAYNNHMAEHDPNRGPLECAVCRKRFSLRRVLARHLRTSHEQLYRCSRCPATCRARQALSHMNRHEGVTETIKCTQCDFVTDQRSKYLRHLARTHGPRHACPRCHKRFVTPRGLSTHTKRGHTQGQGEGAFRCGPCGASFRTEAAWRVHMASAAPHQQLAENSNVCKKCFASFSSLTELTAHNDAQHAAENVYPRTCSICGCVLGSNRESWLHVVHAHPDRKHAYRSLVARELCELCGKGFKSVTDLRMHALRHAGPRAVPCPLCPRKFFDHYQQRMHQRNVHCEQRPHQCPVCRRQFKVKGNMTRHMLVHTGERPHACSVCGKSFSQAASRDLHHRTVHLRLPHPPRARRRKQQAGPSTT